MVVELCLSQEENVNQYRYLLRVYITVLLLLPCVSSATIMRPIYADTVEEVEQFISTVTKSVWTYDWTIDSEPCDGCDSKSDINPEETIRDMASEYPNPACIYSFGCCGINAWFWDASWIFVPHFSNERFWLYNSSSLPQQGAQFFQKVISAASSFRCAGYNQGGGCPDGYATFYDGYELNVTPVNCEVDYSTAIAEAELTGDIFYLPVRETWITMNPDGTMWVYQPDGDPPYSNEPNGALLPIMWNYIVALGGTGSDGDIHVKGTIRGAMTLMAGRRIFVEGDILYYRDPRFHRSRDTLGLLAGWLTPQEGHLTIPDVNPSGPDGDRRIFAYYVGPHCNAGLVVQNYSSRHYEGMLTLYGSIFQGRSYPTSDWDGPHGYDTEFQLDPRGCNLPPPYFPLLEWETE